MSKSKLNEYTIYVKVMVYTTRTVKAASFSEAIKLAEELDVRDIVDFTGDYLDGSIEITGVYK